MMSQFLNSLRKIDQNKMQRHSCYKDCHTIVTSLNSDCIVARIVHGYPTVAIGKNKGARYGHAWVEFAIGNTCWCVDHLFLDTPIPKAAFYAIGEIQEKQLSRYTFRESVRLLLERGHYGPWNEVPTDACFREDLDEACDVAKNGRNHAESR